MSPPAPIPHPDPAGATGGFLEDLSTWLRHRHPREVNDPELLGAAVALVVAPDPDAFILIRRAGRDGDPWSGQMALPGGRRDASDDDLLATALREVSEEVGLRLGPDSFLGALDDVAPRSPHLPPIMVRPFVFAVAEATGLDLNEEVDGAWWTTFGSLIAPGSYREVEIDLEGRPRVFPAYHLPNGVVWGMTERILTPVFRGIGRIP